MVTFTTLDLIASIKRVAHVPQGNETFLPADFLALADMAMRTRISPKISSVREGYWTTYKDYPVENSQNTQYFAIPSLALGSAIVEAKIVNDQNFLPLDRIEINELTSVQFTPRPNYGYYVMDNILNLLPNGGITGSLRLWYNRMPSQLVLPTACGQITDINFATGEVTVGALPSTFTTSTEMDIVSQSPGFNVILKDSAPTSVVGNVLTFVEVPSRVQIGDWVCLSGQSCVIQAPIEWVECLVQATVVIIYEAQGYLTKRDEADKSLEKMMEGVLSLINPRQIQKTKFIAAGGGVLGPNFRTWPSNVGKNQ